MKTDFNEKRSSLFNTAREARLQMQSERFAAVLPKLGEETVKALKEFYSLYDESLYTWLAGLWQPEIGGFYYSNSARDHEGFLPDLESTAQALGFAQKSGLFSAYDNDITKALPEKFKLALISFAKNLQDPDDGYFYHPQWGKDITVSRRGRDLGWALKTIKQFGDEPNYPSALERIKQKNSNKIENTVVPDHFKSIESFKHYLNEMDLGNKSYSFGNMLAAQHSQIKAAGDQYIDAVIDYFNSTQRQDNGLWQEKINYDSVNGLFKISSLYTRFGKPIQNAEAAFESALYVALSDEPVTFVCEFYNPWCVLNDILSNIDKFGKKETAIAIRKRLCEAAPELLRVTVRKVSAHKKADGSFSYAPNNSASRSQGAPVAVPGTNEGDVNASCISSTGTLLSGVCVALGIDPIPLFCEEDSRLFITLLESAEAKPKIAT
ncbi:MAG: hypothetical protein J6B48_00665 [Clostridia bacterium]|nr:hypothetical protein [Clostridia bacterium]